MNGLLDGAVATNVAVVPTSWKDKTPADILADFNELMAQTWDQCSIPDNIYIPWDRVRPVRFRLGKIKRAHRPARFDCFSREHRLQAMPRWSWLK
jgi:hypothetical protein